MKLTKIRNVNKDYLYTHAWYWVCKKLNSSLMRSKVSAIVNFIGPAGGWGPYTKITNNKKS